MNVSQEHLVFAALADPTRRFLFEQLCKQGSGTTTRLAAHLPITRQAVTKHLTALVEAGLVTAHEEGRERRYVPHPEMLQTISRWFAEVEATWDQRLANLRDYLLAPDACIASFLLRHLIIMEQAKGLGVGTQLILEQLATGAMKFYFQSVDGHAELRRDLALWQICQIERAKILQSRHCFW